VILLVVVLPHIHTGVSHVLWPELVVRRPPFGWQYSWLIINGAGMVGLTLWLIARSGETPERFGLGRPRWSADIGAAFGVLIAELWLGDRLADMLSGVNADWPGSSNQSYPLPPERWWEYMLCITAGLAVGISEELLFRAYLITVLERLLRSTGQAVLVSALMFAAIHLYQGPAGLITMTAFGLMSGAVYMLQRRVWTIALSHAVYDIYLFTTG
jgi:uncharacterized protein